MIMSSRRDVLSAFGAASASALLRGGTPKPIRLGGEVFVKTDDPRELAREYRRLGYSAARCPKGVKVQDTARVREIEKAFAAENVVIAEIGAWRNLLEPDQTQRKANFEYVTECLALAEAVGARCCVDTAGSYNPTLWLGHHPKNLSQECFDATVENCRRLIDAVKPKRTRFTIEPMGWVVPDGPDAYLKLMRAVNRPAFAVHIDICNWLNCPRRFYQNGEFISECFLKLGRWVVSCHAKDLRWVVERSPMNVHYLEVPPGQGEVDYRAYLREVSQLPTDVPLMLEHMKTAGEYESATIHLRKVAAELGLKFV